MSGSPRNVGKFRGRWAGGSGPLDVGKLRLRVIAEDSLGPGMALAACTEEPWKAYA